MAAFAASDEQHAKLVDLRELLSSLGSVAVSFSAGVDSTFLLAVAHEELGTRAFAVTSVSALVPQREIEESLAFCRTHGIEQVIADFDFQAVEGFASNPRNRCYLCKSALFGRLRAAADERAHELGLIGEHERVPFAEGSNVSDLSDFRPGAQAVKEQGALSPLQTCGLTKQDIRDLSREMGLPTWDKPSFACLASRFVYGETIAAELLRRVDRAEQLLFEAGFGQMRVRIHDDGSLARVEVTPDRLEDAFAYLQAGGSEAFHDLGFKHVSLDLDGYRIGSMNA